MTDEHDRNVASPPSNSKENEGPTVIGEGSKVELDLEKECPILKDRYNQCFLKWYNEGFLRNQIEPNTEACKDEFEEYRSCMIISVKNKKLEYLLDRDFVREAQEENWEPPQKKKSHSN